MVEHCDFDEQVSTTTDEGRLRPDMIVHLPGGGEVVIDAKVPLDAFLKFIDADDDDERKGSLQKHAGQLRTHVDQLAKKEYWRQFERSPEFVVAFIPGDQLLAAAFEADPTLQEHAMGNGILLTTPITLVALLRTVALCWQQETLAESAREVQKLGAELYERLRIMSGHMQSLQRSLTSSVEAYNKAVGSFESRVLVSARKFPSLGRECGRRDRGSRSDRDGAPPPAGVQPDSTRTRAGSRPSWRCRRAAPTPAPRPQPLPGGRQRRRARRDREQPRRTLRECCTSTAPIAPTPWCRCWPVSWPSRSRTR